MELISIKDLYRNREQYLNQEVTIGGWLRSKRDSKTFGFLVINDGTFFEPLQVVYSDGLANFSDITKLNVGAALIVRGTLVPTPQAKQPFEIQAARCRLRALPLRIIRCRRNGTALSICGPSLIFVREPIHFKLYFVCGL